MREPLGAGAPAILVANRCMMLSRHLHLLVAFRANPGFPLHTYLLGCRWFSITVHCSCPRSSRHSSLPGRFARSNSDMGFLLSSRFASGIRNLTDGSGGGSSHRRPFSHADAQGPGPARLLTPPCVSVQSPAFFCRSSPSRITVSSCGEGANFSNAFRANCLSRFFG